MRFARLTAVTAMLASTCLHLGTADTSFAAVSLDLVGPLGSGSFGGQFYTLANGNFVIVDSDFDSATAVDVGAVYFYNGANHTLVSTLTGTTAGDSVGSGGIVGLTNGNFVVISSNWDNGPVVNAGAATWVSGTVGLNAAVSPSNSVVGGTANDHVGGGGAGVVALANGNYVVVSPSWDSGGIADRGAATWGSGAAGTAGVVDGTNSIVGTLLNDRVGSAGVIPLSGGGYVVASPDWDFGATVNVGAATWAAGTAPTAQAVGAGNSLVGVVPNDHVADNGVVALSSGHYVIESSQWHDVGTSAAGAVTWANGTMVSSGQVDFTNSLVGSSANDHVGDVTPLPNGNYVVTSPDWDNGLLADAGAITFGSPLGVTGQISMANSIIGDHTNDRVGSDGVTVLTNSNYVVASPSWNGALGAATFGLAAGPTTGTVGLGNSIVGSVAGDSVGSDGVYALANGNYVVASADWNNGVLANVGAIRWGNGNTGSFGAVTAANSLVGAAANDHAGSGGVQPLANGSYVVSSPSWMNGPSPGAGAATWISPLGLPTGSISTANSIYGVATNDRVGLGGIVALPNSNYVIASPDWNAGAVIDAGAVTFAVGSGTSTAPVSTANSLVGSSANDSVGGGGVTPTSNGNYVVDSPNWNSGAVTDAGAATWASGTTGITGAVSATNSLVGSSPDDRVGSDGVTALPNGSYLVSSFVWDNGGTVDAGAVTFGGLGGVRGTISTTNSAVGLNPGDFTAVSDRLTTEGAVLISRVARNTVTIYITDITPPFFAAPPPNVTAVAPPGAPSTAVTYTTPVASDTVGAPTVVCTPPSGSLFAVGVTLVTCTATNSEGLTATATFTVTVTIGTDYVPLAPVRLADTRAQHTTVDGLFAGTGALSTGSVLELTVAGRGGVPTNAVAATLNVTVTEPAAPGFATVYPCGSPRPTTSNLNFDAGTTIPNAVMTKIGTDGKVCIYASQPLQLVVDVNGEYPPTTSYHAINPARLLDSRAGQPTIDGQQRGGGPLKAGTVTTVQVAGRASVPNDATAAVLNVTVTEPVAAGYATVFPCGSQPPTASNLNYVRSSTIPNLVVAKIGATGTVCVFTQFDTQLVVDVNGYFPAVTSYKALDPVRLLDTRPSHPTVDGLGAGAGVRPTGTVTVMHVAGRGGVPANAVTAVLNVTVTEPLSAGYVTVYPCGIDPPLASNLNFVAGQTIPNAVVAKIGTNGDVCMFNSQPLQLVADVNGYFPPS